ncbi:PAS domain-containing sensor histidine kinase [Azohydromonas caseinilytica]|uniref:histidine kinase n=1 Tax=Azohydromonas caseinilytica TaxID=2728836 RepID=A0A848FHW4_9BURK|nr:PAS domain-containing sensor histidine kinase [Azohydromonas caseinilytica]NML17441.1 PAS domain S-box protein [Azohydromonas caseinilytica]
MAPTENARVLDRWLHQNADHAVIVIGLDGRIQQWLGACERLFGYSAAQAVGQPGAVLFTEEDRQRGLPELELQEALHSPRSEDDRWHVRRDGSRVYVIGSAVAVRDEHGQPMGFVKMLLDRTDKRSYLEALENRLREQANTKAYKEVAVTTLAHELRNPLAPLSNAVQLIRLTPGAQNIELPLGIIERQLDALRRLVDDLSDAGRVSSHKMSLHREQTDLAALLRELASGMSSEFQGRQLTLTVLLPPTPILLELDRGRLQQAVMNLLSNALRYTPAGGQVWLKGTVEVDHAVIRVSDTGIGLAPETLPHIFELFTRAPSAESLAPSGMGIGLALVKQIAELHGGAVEVRSDGPGKGCEFSLRLPSHRHRLGPDRTT